MKIRWYKHTLVYKDNEEKNAHIDWAKGIGLKLGDDFDIWWATKSDHWREPVKGALVFRRREDKTAFILKFR